MNLRPSTLTEAQIAYLRASADMWEAWFQFCTGRGRGKGSAEVVSLSDYMRVHGR